MTSTYHTLQERPTTGIDRGDLTPRERADLRSIDVTGDFERVYYLAGDESAAARVFVTENEDELDNVAFSGQNVVSSNVSTEVYDLILHHAGERVREVYTTVVREDRPSGVTWVVDRDHYEIAGRSRYTTGTANAAKLPPGVSLDGVFEEIVGRGEPVVARSLEAAGIEGGVRQVLDYYRVAPGFACSPTTLDGELAVVPASE